MLLGLVLTFGVVTLVLLLALPLAAAGAARYWLARRHRGRTVRGPVVIDGEYQVIR
jgi:hypothetical protein